MARPLGAVWPNGVWVKYFGSPIKHKSSDSSFSWHESFKVRVKHLASSHKLGSIIKSSKNFSSAPKESLKVMHEFVVWRLCLICSSSGKWDSVTTCVETHVNVKCELTDLELSTLDQITQDGCWYQNVNRLKCPPRETQKHPSLWFYWI